MQCSGLHEGKTVNGEIGDISLNFGPKEKKAFNLRKHEFGYGHQKENKNKRTLPTISEPQLPYSEQKALPKSWLLCVPGAASAAVVMILPG